MSLIFERPKSEKRKVRGFSLSQRTSDLIDEIAAQNNVTASRVVDVALGKYLAHLEQEFNNLPDDPEENDDAG